MQRQYNIRWRESDSQTLAKAVRKFNAKRTRLLKQVPELEDFLPDKMSVADIRKSTRTRKDFNRTIDSIERFMKKGAEKPIITSAGVKTTAYGKREIELKIRRINRDRAAQRKKANVSTEKGTMGTIQANNLLPKTTNIDKVKKSDWDAFIRSVEKQSKSTYRQDKAAKYKQNFIHGINNVFGQTTDDMLALLDQIDPEVLAQAYYDDTELQIDFIYDPIDLQLRYDTIMEHLMMLISTNKQGG